MKDKSTKNLRGTVPYYRCLIFEPLPDEDDDGAAPTPVLQQGVTVGYRSGNLAIVFKRRVPRTQQQRDLAQSQNIQRFIIMTDKYQWVEAQLRNGHLERCADGKKPKHLALHLSRN